MCGKGSNYSILTGIYLKFGELKKLMIVVNLGAVVSAKLGETSKQYGNCCNKSKIHAG